MHSEGKPIAQDADLDGLAKRTVGMSGADLANVINEAALLTARENGTVITGAALEEAVDRVVGGPRRKSRIISEHEKKITAYHEGGHTLAAWAMPDIEPIYKVTILARGRTGGHAMAVPEDDKGLMTRSEMIARLVFAMGGRAAEELVFREPTTGASSDIDQATKIARAMVTEYGMSAKLGAVRYGTEHGDPFLGRSMGTQADYCHEVAQIIDDEVRKLIEAAHTEAWAILTEYRDVLDILAGELLEKETLHRAELEAIFADVKKRPRMTVFDDFGGRVPSDKPPIKTPGELAIERGEPWPPPVPEPAFKAGDRRGRQGCRGGGRPERRPAPAGHRTAPAATAYRRTAPDATGLRCSGRLARPGWPPQPGPSRRQYSRRATGTHRQPRSVGLAAATAGSGYAPPPAVPHYPPARADRRRRRRAAPDVTAGPRCRLARCHRSAGLTTSRPEARDDAARTTRSAHAGRRVRSGAGRGGGTRTAARGRREPGPARPARYACPGRARLPRDVRRAVRRPGRGAEHDLRRAAPGTRAGRDIPMYSTCEHHLVSFHGWPMSATSRACTAG